MVRIHEGSYSVYECSPVDWWAGWMTPQEAVAAYRNERASVMGPGESAEDFARRLDTAIERIGIHLLDEFGWEGDGQWRVTVLPDPDTADCLLMFSVKQDHNGTTFVVSPRDLPWLGKDRADEWRYTIGLRLTPIVANNGL